MEKYIHRMGIFAILILVSSSISVGADSSIHGFRLGINDRAMMSLTLSYVNIQPALDGQDWEFETGFNLPIFLTIADRGINDLNTFIEARKILCNNEGKWQIPLAAALHYDQQKMTMGRYRAFSTEVGIKPMYGEAKRIGMEVLWRENWLTHLHHSEYSLNRFEGRYEGEKIPASDLLIGQTGRSISAGLVTQWEKTSGRRFELSGGLKFRPSPFAVTTEGMMFGQLPFYTEMSYIFY